MGQNPYNHEVDDQRAELTSAFVAAFEDAGTCSPERLAQLALAVVCDNTASTLDLIAFEDEWIASLIDGDSEDAPTTFAFKTR